MADPFGYNSDYTVHVEAQVFLIERVEFDFCGSGLRIGAGTAGGRQTMVRDCWFQNSGTDVGSSIRVEETGIASTDNVTITGCFIDGGQSPTEPPAVHLINVEYCKVIGNAIYNFGEAVELENCSQTIVSGNDISCDSGILSTTAGTDNIITDNYIETFGGDGIVFVTGGTYTTISVTDNIVHDMAGFGHGITATGLTLSKVADNMIYEAGNHGIILDGVTSSNIHDNLIVRPGQQTNNTYDGIILQGNSDANWLYNNRVIGSSVSPKPRYGLNISAATCDNNRIDEHEFGAASDYGTGTYNNAGTGTIEHDTLADPADTAQVTTTTVVNTVTETEIASLEIPQGDLVAGQMYRLSLWGDYLNNSGAPRQITIRVKLNGTTALTAVIASINAGANRRKWHLDIEVLGETTAVQRVGAFWRMSDQTADTMSVHANSARQATGYNTGAQDTNAGVIDVSVTAQHGTAAATIDIRRQMAKLERV